MRVPLSWVREFVDIPSGVSSQEIAEALIRVGFEVEEIIEQGEGLSGPVLFAKVISIEEITEFKKPIRFVGLDCKEETVRYVICGATNFEVGDVVVAALPGAILPGDFKIAARETYGKVSNGMICSSRELGLGDDHSGIMTFAEGEAALGSDAVSALQIFDTIFDVSINPDRGYALSIRGISREIAIALNLKYTDPIDALRSLEFEKSGEGIKGKILDDSAASIFYLRTLSNIDASSKTPMWMRTRLEKMGMRSISLVVDITNYVMLELGQPLHAFDAAKIKGGLSIKRAGIVQPFTTLDGQERQLDPDDLMVWDDAAPLALAGTMGGLHSEITSTTTDIAVESVRFDPVAIARNARRHKISSEASKRLERSVDPELAEFASARFVQLLTQNSTARYVDTSVDGAVQQWPSIPLTPQYISNLLGFDIDEATIFSLLRSIGCDVLEATSHVVPASWRPDLRAPSDLAEEVARLIGYDKIPSILPPRPVHATLTPAQKRRRAVGAMLAHRGFAEVQTFPFTNQETIDEMGFLGDRAATYRIANPMSEEFPLMRVHLVPGLIEVAARNINRGAKDFAIFEMGSIFRSSQKLIPAISPKLTSRPDQKIIDEIYASVPPQAFHVAGLLVGHSEEEDWQGAARAYSWQDAISFAQEILEMCHLSWEVRRSDFAPWHPGRCAELIVDGKAVAHAGEIHPRIIAKYGLPPRSAAFAVGLSALPDSAIVTPSRVGTMPAAVQDVALIVDAHVPAQDVEAALREGAGELLESVKLFDRYDKIGDGKISLAFTLTFRAPDRTLTGAEITQMRENAVVAAQKATGAFLRTA